MRTKSWVFNPRAQKRVIGDRTRASVGLACDRFVERHLRPRFVRPFNPENKRDPQCTAVHWKWRRHLIYFKATYRDVLPNAREASYDYSFARLEYMSGDLFHLAYLRHTGEWWPLTFGEGNSLEACLKLIRTLPVFEPCVF